MRLNSCFTQFCWTWSNHLNFCINLRNPIWSLYWFCRHWSLSLVNFFCPWVMVRVRMTINTLVFIGVPIFNFSENITRMVALIMHSDVFVVIFCPVVHLRWRQVVCRIFRIRSTSERLVALSISCTAWLLSLFRKLSDTSSLERLGYYCSWLINIVSVNILKQRSSRLVITQHTFYTAALSGFMSLSRFLAYFKATLTQL